MYRTNLLANSGLLQENRGERRHRPEGGLCLRTQATPIDKAMTHLNQRIRTCMPAHILEIPNPFHDIPDPMVDIKNLSLISQTLCLRAHCIFQKSQNLHLKS